MVKTISFAITAGTRAGLQGSASYAGAPKTGIVMNSTGVGEILESNNEAFPLGAKVLTMTGWQAYSVQKPESLTLIREDVDPSLYLGPLGINGLTAYFGLLEIGQPKAGETVMISAAAGSVGHMVGQIAKIKGCKVVVGEGFEPSNSERADLQSAAFNHFAIPPVLKFNENTRKLPVVYPDFH